MVHYPFKLIVFLLSLFVMGSCTLETSDNGDLDGYWKLCSVDTLATGGSCDFTDKSTFWSVQHHLLTVRDNSDPLAEYIFRFDLTKDSLHLYEAKQYIKDTGDTLVTNPRVIAPFGVNAVDVTFHIDQLSSRYMQLTNKNYHLRFKKF